MGSSRLPVYSRQTTVSAKAQKRVPPRRDSVFCAELYRGTCIPRERFIAWWAEKTGMETHITHVVAVVFDDLFIASVDNLTKILADRLRIMVVRLHKAGLH